MKPWNKIFCSLISLSASLALISCGGGQAGTPPPQNPPSQNPQPSITSVAPTSVPAGGLRLCNRLGRNDRRRRLPQIAAWNEDRCC